MHKNNFDFLRFFFAFVVVISHIISLSSANEFSFLSPYFDTHLCVTGFFVVSGFLIAQSFERSSSLGSYFNKRARRLLPGYIFVICFSAVALQLVSTLSPAAYFTNSGLFKYLAANLTFLNFLQPCLPGVFSENKFCAVNGALWTIKVEVAFYISLPVIIYIIRRTEQKILVLGSIYILSIFYQLVLAYMHKKTGNPVFNTLNNQLPAFLTYFSAGIALHYYLPVFLTNQKKFVAPALVVFVAEYVMNTEFLRPLAWAIIILFVAYNFRILNNFGKYGDFSYGIYIFHFPIVQTFTALGAFKSGNAWLAGLCIITLVLGVSFLSWNLLEKRFIRRKSPVSKPVYSASTISE